MTSANFKYSAKRAAALLATSQDTNQTAEVTPSHGATLPASVLDVAQSLQSFTKYSDFVVAGSNGSNATLFLEGVIFAYMVGNDHVAKVMKTSNPDVRVGDFVFINEVRHLSEKGEVRYYPRADRYADLENRRAEMFRVLLGAIAKEGGHQAIVQAFEEDRILREAEGFAQKIREDIENGTLESDPMKMFDDRKAQRFGFIVDGKPVVMQSGYQAIGFKKNRRQVYCLRVTDAPLGTSGAYQVGTYLHIGYIFNGEPPTEEVAALSAAVVSVFAEEQVEEAKALASAFMEGDNKSANSVDILQEKTFTHQAPNIMQ